MNDTSSKIFTTIMRSLSHERPELQLYPYQDHGVIMIHNESGKLVTEIRIVDIDES